MDPRREDLLELLEAAVTGRRADLLPIRWGRMAASPFGFFRGTAALMARDIGPMPTAGLEVQVCGDAHLLNLGAYAAPDGHLVFDLNDFDETCRGPFEWDLKRLGASFVVAGRVVGIPDGDCSAAVRSLVRAYRESVIHFSRLPALELVRYEITPRRTAKPLAPIFERAARTTPQLLADKVTIADGRGYRRFRSDPPLLASIGARQARAVLRSLSGYRETLGPARRQTFDAYSPFDLAFKVVGTGSVGVEDYLVLLYGNGPGDPLFLQVKEEDASCWKPYSRGERARGARSPNQGRRACEGQLRTQTAADPFLGWTAIGAKDFLVRQWSDHKANMNVHMLSAATIADDALVCGQVLAKAHARTGDAAEIAGYCGTGSVLDRAIARFAVAYADQVEADHARFRKAVRRGDVPVVEGI